MALDTSALDQLSAAKAARDILRESTNSSVTGEGGPTGPSIDTRVAVLEGGLKDMKASVQSIQLSIARIEGTIGGLATKADVAGLKGSVDTVTARVDAQIGRLTALEVANTGTINLALSKTIGVQDAVVLFVSMAAVVTIVISLLRYIHFVP